MRQISRLCYNRKDLQRLAYWHVALISTLRRQGQADLYELEVSLVYTVSSRPTGAI